MAEEWIRVNAKLLDHPKLVRMANHIRSNGSGATVSEDNVLSGILRIWCVVNAHARIENDDAVVRYCDTDTIDVLSKLRGLGKAMVSVGWAIEEPGSIVRFPKFLTYNIPPETRERLKDRERKRRNSSGKKPETDRKVSGITPETCSVLVCSVNTPKERDDSWETIQPKLPAPLKVERFKVAWESWATYRRETKHSLTPTTITKQLEQFAKEGVDRSVAAIEQSIAAGWRKLVFDGLPVSGIPPRPVPARGFTEETDGIFKGRLREWEAKYGNGNGKA